jgi:dihydrolipoamide dehydrogenase
MADNNSSFDLVVIGAGPGGYVAAIRAAQVGMKVACVDRQFLGGTCLNVGCIPSKALLDSSERFHEAKNKLSHHGINVGGAGGVTIDIAAMLARKDKVVKQLTDGVGFLLKKNKVEAVMGRAKLAGAGTVEVTTADGTVRQLAAKNILIATGSTPIELPGLKFDGKFVVDSTGALNFNPVPAKLLVVGGGYIGIELGSVWKRLGSDVLVVEFTDRIIPLMDQELTGQLHKMLDKQGMRFKFGTAATGATVKGDKVEVTLKSGDQTTVETVDRVLVATGRKPVTDGLGLAEAGVALDGKGFVVVDTHTYKTNVPGVWAIGDVIGGLMLAHKAEEEGIAAVEIMAGKAGHVNYKVVPGVVYTHPELAQVGLTEADAKREGIEVRVGKFPLRANGRALAMDDAEGTMKVVADAKTDRLLGVQILAPHASDIIAEACVAMEFHSSVEDLARTMHAHPTLPEALKEAAMAVDKRAIHFT